MKDEARQDGWGAYGFGSQDFDAAFDATTSFGGVTPSFMGGAEYGVGTRMGNPYGADVDITSFGPTIGGPAAPSISAPSAPSVSAGPTMAGASFGDRFGGSSISSTDFGRGSMASVGTTPTSVTAGAWSGSPVPASLDHTSGLFGPGVMPGSFSPGLGIGTPMGPAPGQFSGNLGISAPSLPATGPLPPGRPMDAGMMAPSRPGATSWGGALASAFPSRTVSIETDLGAATMAALGAGTISLAEYSGMLGFSEAQLAADPGLAMAVSQSFASDLAAGFSLTAPDYSSMISSYGTGWGMADFAGDGGGPSGGMSSGGGGSVGGGDYGGMGGHGAWGGEMAGGGPDPAGLI